MEFELTLENDVVDVGTNDYEKLFNKPQINGTELIDNKSLADLGIQPAGDYALDSDMQSITNRVLNAESSITSLSNDKANRSELPTKTSDITNDSGFITKEVNNLTNYTLATSTGSQIALEIDNSTYKFKAKLKDKNGNVIHTSNEIDLPLETMVVNATYDDTTKKIILTLQNGNTVEFSVADLVSGLVSETQLQQALALYYTKAEIDALLANKANISEITALKERDAKIISQIPTGTASGITIDLDDSSDLEFDEFNPKGRSTQETYNGENLFDKNTMGRIFRYITTNDEWLTSSDSYSVAIPCKPNRSYTISHSVTTATVFRCAYIKEQAIPATGKVNTYNTYMGTTDTSYTITTGEGATFLIFQGNASAMSDIINSLQIIGNYIEPSVNYPQTIYSAGENGSITENVVTDNWFDGQLTRGSISSGSNIRLRSTNQIGVIPNEDFTLSLDTNYTIRALIYEYDENDTRTQLTDNFQALPYTFKPNATTKKIRFVLKRHNDNELLIDDVSNVQIQKGTAVLPYVAHAEQNISIPCQQPMRSIGDVEDEFVKINDVWYERHYINYIASYAGETITTDYMSTTGGLDTGASVQYVATTPTDLPCTQAQITALEALKDVHSYRNVTHIYPNDETPATVDTVYRKDLTTMFNEVATLKARVDLLEN